MLFCVCRVEESHRTPAVIEFLFFFLLFLFCTLDKTPKGTQLDGAKGGGREDQ